MLQRRYPDSRAAPRAVVERPRDKSEQDRSAALSCQRWLCLRPLHLGCGHLEERGRTSCKIMYIIQWLRRELDDHSGPIASSLGYGYRIEILRPRNHLRSIRSLSKVKGVHQERPQLHPNPGTVVERRETITGRTQSRYCSVLLIHIRCRRTTVTHMQQAYQGQ